MAKKKRTFLEVVKTKLASGEELSNSEKKFATLLGLPLGKKKTKKKVKKKKTVTKKAKKSVKRKKAKTVKKKAVKRKKKPTKTTTRETMPELSEFIEFLSAQEKVEDALAERNAAKTRCESAKRGESRSARERLTKAETALNTAQEEAEATIPAEVRDFYGNKIKMYETRAEKYRWFVERCRTPEDRELGQGWQDSTAASLSAARRDAGQVYAAYLRDTKMPEERTAEWRKRHTGPRATLERQFRAASVRAFYAALDDEGALDTQKMTSGHFTYGGTMENIAAYKAAQKRRRRTAGKKEEALETLNETRKRLLKWKTRAKKKKKKS